MPAFNILQKEFAARFVTFTECVNVLSRYNFWSWKESVSASRLSLFVLTLATVPFFSLSLVPLKPRFTFWVRPRLSHREKHEYFLPVLYESFRSKVYAQVTEHWFERRYSLKTLWPISKSKIKCAWITQELSVWTLYANPLPWSDDALTDSVLLERRASVYSGLVFSFSGRNMCRSFQIQEI